MPRYPIDISLNLHIMVNMTTNERLTEFVQIVVTPSMKAAMEQAAAKDHRRLSDWLRLLIGKAIEAEEGHESKKEAQ